MKTHLEPSHGQAYNGNHPKLWAAGRAFSIAGAMLRERVSPPVARTREDVPRDPHAITLEWLTDVLCHAQPGAKVEDFKITTGTCQTTSRAGIAVEYNAVGKAAGLPTKLFAKFTTGFGQRLLVGAAGQMYGESFFYTRFRSRINFESPNGYWGGVDANSWRSMILMEDIAHTRGATFVEPTTPLSRRQVEELVDNLAACHGTWWESPELNVLKTTKDHLRLVSGFADMGGRAAVGIKMANDIIPPGVRGQADRLWRGAARALEDATTKLPRTLLHGDCHVGQGYINGEGHMGIADWQSIMTGNWAYDYSYLVGSSCEPDDRRAWERDLLNRYLTKLAEAGGKSPSFEEAWQLYRSNMCYPCTAWSFAFGHAFYQPEMQPADTCRTVIRRLATAVDDLKSFEALGV